jgi:hypothetical protein
MPLINLICLEHNKIASITFNLYIDKFQTVSNNILNSNSNFFTTENAKNLINRKKEKNQKNLRLLNFVESTKWIYLIFV